MEVIVCSMFLAFNLRVLFPGLDLPQPSFLARVGQRFGIEAPMRQRQVQPVSVYEYNMPSSRPALAKYQSDESKLAV